MGRDGAILEPIPGLKKNLISVPNSFIKFKPRPIRDRTSPNSVNIIHFWFKGFSQHLNVFIRLREIQTYI